MRERLQKAVGTGELVGIVYRGGSQPGAFREIAPLQVIGQKVRARCYTSNAVKVFSIEKIELRERSTTKDETWDPQFVKRAAFRNIADLYEICKTELSPLGWQINLEQYEGGEQICLRRFFKNGKPRKTPFVTIGYETMAWDAVAQLDGSIARENYRPRQRPWIVRSRNFEAAKTYADPIAAVQAFLAEAKALVAAPNILA